MTERPKPCPFCGGPVVAVKALTHGDADWIRHVDDRGVTCGMAFDNFATGEDDIITAWNRRAPAETPA